MDWNPAKGLSTRDTAENNWSSYGRDEARREYDNYSSSQKDDVDRHSSWQSSFDRD